MYVVKRQRCVFQQVRLLDKTCRILSKKWLLHVVSRGSSVKCSESCERDEHQTFRSSSQRVSNIHYHSSEGA